MSLRSASRTTGTTSPLGVSAAKPRCRYLRTMRLAPSGASAVLKRGNSCSALTQARMMKASGVSFTPAACALSLRLARSCSSSVMSASSNCVTCGMLTQLACRRDPEMRWMRDSGSSAVGPNCAKSTGGTSGSAGRAAAPPAAAPAAGAPPPRTCLTNALTSSWVMRSLKPWPATWARFTPSSRANLRTEGPAWARENPGSSMGARSWRYEVGTPSCDSGTSLPPERSAGGAAAGGGAGAACGGGAGRAAGAAAAGAPAPSARSVASRSPLLSVPPLVAWIFSMTPLAVDGTSIAALSDSRVTSGVSTPTLSPGFTSTSMTATSLKLPRSGTRTSTRPVAAFMRTPSDLPGHGLGGVDAQRLDGTVDRGVIDTAVVGERLERGDRDVAAVDLEVPPQRRARVRAAEAIGAERHVASVHPLADLVGHRAHVIGRRNHRALAPMQHLPHVRHARRLARVQQVPALALERLAAQLAEAGHRQHVGRDAVVVLEELRRREALTQDRARAEQRRAHLAAAADLQQVAAAEDAGLDARRHGRLGVVLVHQRDVVEDVFLLGEHAPQPVVDDHGQLVGIGRVVGHAVRHRRRDQLAVAVLMLQALAGERGASGGRAQQEAARLDVARGPDKVADALEAEHRVEDVER